MRPGTRVSSDIPMCTGKGHYPAPTLASVHGPCIISFLVAYNE